MSRIRTCQNCHKRRACIYVDTLAWWLCGRCVDRLLMRDDVGPDKPSESPLRAESAARNAGEKNGRWKGGQWVNSRGYVMVLVGRDHPMANCRQYAPRCRVVLFDTQGPPPTPVHGAHHIDGDKQNDDPSNLEWREPSDHSRHHLNSDRARVLGKKGGKATARARRKARRNAA